MTIVLLGHFLSLIPLSYTTAHIPALGFCGCKSGPHSQHHTMDDVFGDDELAPRVDPTADITRSHHKQGYVDGLSHNKLTNLQNGFDNGFPKGADLGLHIGAILCAAQAFDSDLYKQAVKELSVANVLNKQYFNDEVELEAVHPLIEKWETMLGMNQN